MNVLSSEGRNRTCSSYAESRKTTILMNLMNNQMKRYIVLLAFSFLVQIIIAQAVWKGELLAVSNNDYYNIELTQELIGAGLNHLKIVDEENHEVPYFIRSSNPIQEINNFEDFDLQSNRTRDSLNIVVVHNHNGENLNRFCIVLQRADAQKYAVIRGSNDLKQWYIVKQQTEISRLGQQSDGNTEMLILDFPQGNYRYYEITLWNNQQSPLEILRVGKIKNSNLYGNFMEIKPVRFLQENNNQKKETHICFPELKHFYCINKIEFGIKNKPDYYRQIMIMDSISYDREYLTLSSRSENMFYLNDFFLSKKSCWIIENQNNPPLEIDSIKFYGLCRYACAYLEAGRKYRLISNSDEYVSGTYDIEHFRNEIPDSLQILQPTNLNYKSTEKNVHKRELSIIEQPLFLWSVIAIVGAFLLFVCVRMIKEMKKK